MAIPSVHLCTVVQCSRQGNFAELLLSAPALAAAARPGQFVHIRCSAAQLLRRPISVCDAQNGCLRLVFQVKGAGTAWLAARTAGDSLDVLGPLGSGFTLPSGRILVAGGGIGLPPLLYAARLSGQADCVAGFRSAEQAILLEDFQAVCGEVLTVTDDGSLGEAGFTADGVARMLARRPCAAVLACGPQKMLQTTAQAAAAAGVPCQVSLEERMGCGLGACLVCAVPIVRNGERQYLHVCKDGPVFPAEEVDWNG